MKRCFLIEIEPWKRPLLVVVGGYLEDIVGASSVFGKTNSVIRSVKNEPPEKGDEACHWHKDGETIVWFEDYRNDDEWKSIVVHETNHVLYDLARYVGFVDEPEGSAYTQQNVWLEIVKRLSE